MRDKHEDSNGGIDSAAQVTPEALTKEYSKIKSLKSNGKAHLARAREEVLYEHVAEAIMFGIITSEDAGTCARDAVEEEAPRFRLLP